MTLYIKIINKLMKALEAAEAVLLFISVIFVSLQVFTRYVLNNPLSWTEQSGRYLFVWMMMLGLPIMFNRSITMAFDMLLEHLPRIPRIILSTALKLMCISFCAFWCYSGILYVLSNGARPAAGLEIPLGFVYSAQPIGAGLMVFVLLKQIFETFLPEREPKEVV